MPEYDYDAVVIGGGSAGLTASGIAANFGAKTMMVEADRLGGDCTWTGCVPSKALLKAGKVAQYMRKAGDYGLADAEPEVDFKKVIRHIHFIREQVYEDADAPEIYESMGIGVIHGKASFVDEHTLHISRQDDEPLTVSSRYFFICTGSQPQIPPISGIDSVPALTTDSFFELEDLPGELIIVGAGPVGCELAQAMNRLGFRVTVVDMAGRILEGNDPELSKIVFDRLKSEGIDFVMDAQIREVRRESGITLRIGSEEQEQTLTCDALLMATGRRAQTKGLNLEATGVEYSEEGIQVNEKCQTNIPHIYACGDVTGEYQLTHMSEHMAKVAVTSALLKYPVKIDRDHVSRCTYTDPELAQVGATEKQLREQNIRYEVYRFPYSKIDRAVIESEREGLIKIFAKKWSGKILGACIVGTNAGEIISEYAVAMKNGVSLRNLADTIHPYPTYGLGARRAADQWYIKNQSEWSVKLIKRIFGYRGEVPDYSDPDRIV